MRLVSIVILVLLGLFACKHDPQVPDNDQPDGDKPLTECHPDTVYFINTIEPLLNSGCARPGCHDDITQQNGVVLTNYISIIATGGVKPQNAADSKIYKVLVEDDPDDIMPPPPNDPLSGTQITQIQKWINQGALNNECIPSCDTTSVTYSEDITEVINTYCLGCHSGVTPSGGVLLDGYNNVVTIANTGKLVGSIRHEQGFTPMPYNSSKLSNCDIRKFEIWIDNDFPQ
jgi:hypothetical protein